MTSDVNMPAAGERPVTLQRLTRWEITAYCVILIFAAFVRLVALDHIPPGLWYDEAIYALDGLDVAHGKFPIFFETEGHMREPLYIYSLGAFFAVFGSSTLKARVVSAMWGIGAVALFFPVARRLAGTRWALVGTLVFAAFRWHVHFSRTIFRALLPSFFMLLLVLFWLRWRARRRPLDAWLCGITLGVGMYTYLSFRLVPIIVLVLVTWEFWTRRMSWRQDGKGLAAIAAGAMLTFLPLGIDYVRHPVHFTGRTSEISMFEKSVSARSQTGEVIEQRIPKPTVEAIRDLADNALDVAKMWTIKGDHVGKHNLPYAPVFDWASGCIFYLGLAWCLLNIRRDRAAILCLAWLVVFSMTSVFSFGAPNLLRMQGATPAVVLIYLLGLRWLYTWLSKRASRTVSYAAVAALVVLFCGLQLYIYFMKFPASVAVRQEFLADVFYAPAEGVLAAAKTHAKVLTPEEIGSTPTFRFVVAPVKNVEAYTPADRLSEKLAHGSAVLVTARSLQLARDAGLDQLAELPANARRLRTYFLPVADANDHVAGQQHWAELWDVPRAQ